MLRRIKRAAQREEEDDSEAEEDENIQASSPLVGRSKPVKVEKGRRRQLADEIEETEE